MIFGHWATGAALSQVHLLLRVGAGWELLCERTHSGRPLTPQACTPDGASVPSVALNPLVRRRTGPLSHGGFSHACLTWRGDWHTPWHCPCSTVSFFWFPSCIRNTSVPYGAAAQVGTALADTFTSHWGL